MTKDLHNLLPSDCMLISHLRCERARCASAHQMRLSATHHPPPTNAHTILCHCFSSLPCRWANKKKLRYTPPLQLDTTHML
jgi:hypothetical protein